MRAEQDWVPKVHKAVTEIKDFYDRCNNCCENRIRLNTSMISYALGLGQTADLFPILGFLQRNGYVLDADHDCVTFSSNFLTLKK